MALVEWDISPQKFFKMYKNLIPELVSVQTKEKTIKGFSFSEDFDFYPIVEKKNPYHYKIEIADVKVPSTYGFRHGYYTKSKNQWYYRRNIVGNISLKFSYSNQNKIFTVNKAYALIPFEFGGIMPAGRHISDLINLDLFLDDYVMFRGCAVRYKNKNICIIAPGYNGKTSFVRALIEEGGEYIAEDILILNLKEGFAFATSNYIKHFVKSSNRELGSILNSKNILSERVKIDKLFLVQNSTEKEYFARNKNLYEYINLNSLFFLSNTLVRSYICEEGLTETIFNKMHELKNMRVKYLFVNPRDFEFKKIVREI